MKKKSILFIAIIFSIIILPNLAYHVTKWQFNRYFKSWGRKLVDLEKRGLLSKEFGVAWQDIIVQDAMNELANKIGSDETNKNDSVRIIDGIPVDDYPSLSIVARLNEINNYSNTIKINDRKGRRIATIRTDHTRGKISEFPNTLKIALIAAEDKTFYENNIGSEFDSYVRATIRAVFKSIRTLSKSSPVGTSTLTQQIAKLFVSSLDTKGRRHVERSIDRKLREMRIASALRMLYSPDEILEVYLNHCIASDFGLIGVKDIAYGLLGKKLNELSDAECIYIARMVKWGKNLPVKIKNQCHRDMMRIATMLDWDNIHAEKVLDEIDALTFKRPKQIDTESGHLIDLANEFWLNFLKKSGRDTDGYYGNMDIINPNSLIRQKGNLVIDLTIDLKLQKILEQLVDKRGYGSDTIIRTDVRIGSYGENIPRFSKKDTLRHISIIESSTVFSEPASDCSVTLEKGDTLITNIRYKKIDKKRFRRSVFYYTRDNLHVNGQYFAYSIMDSKNGELLAYYSLDRIGSRCISLLNNRVPNGSSTAKPILNALNFDLGNFMPYDTWSDSSLIPDTVSWARTIFRKNGKPYNVHFKNSAVLGKPYSVHNHGHIFEGRKYIFDHLSTSNNILGVETIYRLNGYVFDSYGEIIDNAFSKAQLLYRIDAFDRVKNVIFDKEVTGVRIYKELARIVGVNVDSMIAYGRTIPVSDKNYSIALGTLEMTLYEIMHFYNMLYDNDLIKYPAKHPSLVIKRIVMNGNDLSICDHDTVTRYHPFNDINNIRPTWLGMHKRLISNRWDGLAAYDIHLNDTSVIDTLAPFNEYLMARKSPPSNYAKSGTTDDVIRPYNVDINSRSRTNYGLWNAIIRVDMSKFSDDTATEIKDITIACIGECNKQYTGARDGKSLHKFITMNMLHIAGEKVSNGWYKKYEEYIKIASHTSVKCYEEKDIDTVTSDIDTSINSN